MTLPALGVALYLMASTMTRRTAFWTGLGVGTGYFALALAWIVEPFLIDVARHGWMAEGVLVGNGSNEVIQAALAVTLGDGDVAVAPAPTSTT